MSIVSLNEEQKLAVDYSGHSAIIACPGSGKTTTIVHKACKIMRTNPSVSIMLVSFTRESAQEIVKRVKALNASFAKRMEYGTFHSLALRQVGGLGRFKIANDTDRYFVLTRVLKQLNIPADPFELLGQIDRWKTNESLNSLSENEHNILRQYDELLQKNRSYDYSDILAMACKNLSEEESKQVKFSHILVDEFQDTDPLQYKWLKCNSRAGVKVTVVLDDDQSIYAWRNAMGYHGLIQFEQDYGAKRFVLSSNYRSHQEIILSAKSVIEHNKHRSSKNIHSMRGRGGLVEFKSFSTQDGEHAHILTQLKNIDAQTALLCRTNVHLDRLEAILSKIQIPYQRHGGKSIWETHEVSLYVSMLRFLFLNQKIGLTNWLSLLRYPEGEIGRIQKLSVDQALAHLANNTIPEMAIKMDFSKRLQAWQRLLERNNQQGLIYAIYDLALTICKKNPASMRVTWARDALAEKGEKLVPFIKTLDHRHRTKKEEDDVLLHLHTYHSAKGLEYDNVFMPYLTEGAIPSNNAIASTNQQAIEEERRLFYVGITRAIKNVHGTAYDGAKGISRFVKEAHLI
ncbi:MAG: ATP-dependent helicase [Gammaproteobacteria bacterium]|nr:ATP-dependent helicase [Gammaproteobacteria bacterium]